MHKKPSTWHGNLELCKTLKNFAIYESLHLLTTLHILKGAIFWHWYDRSVMIGYIFQNITETLS